MSCSIALGTVQFGLPYGVANQTGQVDEFEGAQIIEHARAAGIDTIDTAIGYGDSEQRLGEIGIADMRVVTKLPAIPAGCDDVRGWVLDAVRQSIQRLKVPRLYALLLHQPQALLAPGGQVLYNALQELKVLGEVRKVGVSIYSPDELTLTMDKFPLDIVQTPLNVIDRKLITSGWLERLVQQGTEVHARSIFLQGLLLMSKERRPTYFDRWNNLWQMWDQWLSTQNLTALQACLGFATSQPGINRVVVGVDSLSQFEEILQARQFISGPVPSEIASNDPLLVNPLSWISRLSEI